MANNDDLEFEALVKRQSRFVFRVVYAILRNSHDAEDVAQEMFLKLYRNNTWQGIEDERAFLARTAWRMAVDRVPQAQMRQATTELGEFDAASSAPTPEQAAISANRHAIVHRMVDTLPQELRQPLALSTIEELNSREIAAILGIPEGTVRTRLLRARQMLKEKLSELMEKRYAR